MVINEFKQNKQDFFHGASSKTKNGVKETDIMKTLLLLISDNITQY